jgi:hypothetical protein
MSCQDPEHKPHWYVTQRNGNASAFNGYRWQWSAYSRVRCPIDGLTWRTKAKFVDNLPDAPEGWSRNPPPGQETVVWDPKHPVWREHKLLGSDLGYHLSECVLTILPVSEGFHCTCSDYSPDL